MAGFDHHETSTGNSAKFSEVATPAVFLSPRAVARRLGVSTTALVGGVAVGEIPPPIRRGRRVAWRAAMLPPAPEPDEAAAWTAAGARRAFTHFSDAHPRTGRSRRRAGGLFEGAL